MDSGRRGSPAPKAQRSAKRSNAEIDTSAAIAEIMVGAPHGVDVNSSSARSRTHPQVKRAFESVKAILDRDFSINASGLKQFILKEEQSLTAETLEKIFQGRNHAKFNSTLLHAAKYFENLADKVRPPLRPREGYLEELHGARDGADLNPRLGGSEGGSAKPASYMKPVRDTAGMLGARPNYGAAKAVQLWTPGTSEEIVMRSYGAELGQANASILAKISIDAVDAIARGDFSRQLEIANQALSMGQDASLRSLEGEALYLQGEAMRLLADFESDRMGSKRLRNQAVQSYERSSDLLEDDPRPIRGRARTIEVLGDLDGALAEFQLTTALAERQAIGFSKHDHHSNSHERVRSLRHKLNCLAAIHSDTLQGSLESVRRRHELRQLLDESDRRHKEVLPWFKSSIHWWQVEWFMADVLHAKGWSAIEEPFRACKRLESALAQRMSMLEDEGLLSAVELGNLRWWAATAKPIASAFEVEQLAPFEQLSDSLRPGAARHMIKVLAAQLIRAGRPSWLV